MRALKIAEIMTLHAQHFGSEEENKLAKKLAQEKAAADAAMAYALANLHMPDDIRSRAKAWRMEAWAEVLWANAFQCGWREAQRALASEATP